MTTHLIKVLSTLVMLLNLAQVEKVVAVFLSDGRVMKISKTHKKA